jgi:hypothetical protein
MEVGPYDVRSRGRMTSPTFPQGRAPLPAHTAGGIPKNQRADTEIGPTGVDNSPGIRIVPGHRRAGVPAGRCRYDASAIPLMVSGAPSPFPPGTSRAVCGRSTVKTVRSPDSARISPPCARAISAAM